MLGFTKIVPELIELDLVSEVIYIEQLSSKYFATTLEFSKFMGEEAVIKIEKLQEELKAKLQEWKVQLDDEDLIELIFFLKATRHVKLSNLETIVKYMFPHENKVMNLLAEIIERNCFIGRKYDSLTFSKFIDLSNRVLDDGFFEEWYFKGGADFTGATVVNGIFKGIQIGLYGKIDFTEAILMNADFTEANFNPEAIFNGADLRNARFVNAVFGKVSFTDADVEGADFTGIRTGGNCLNLHTAKNWDRIIINDMETWESIIQNYYKNAIDCEGDRQTIDKFLILCHAKIKEMGNKK